MTWDRRFYFPSEGRRAEDFFRPKNPTASVGFEPANLGTKGQHATPRPPKQSSCYLRSKISTLKNFIFFPHSKQAVSITCMTYTYCCVYSARLLMIDRKPVRNMQSSILKIN